MEAVARPRLLLLGLDSTYFTGAGCSCLLSCSTLIYKDQTGSSQVHHDIALVPSAGGRRPALQRVSVHRSAATDTCSWGWLTAASSQVDHDIALVQVQAKRALPHREPLRVIALPLVPGCRSWQLHIPRHLHAGAGIIYSADHCQNRVL
jgi:hypothetical protein